MSPRKPAVLRGGDGPGLREHLIATAARLIDERGSAGLSVRDIAAAAQVADGVLYNYFEDKEDLLAHALLAHVAAVMSGLAPMPPAGTGTVAGNLEVFIGSGLATLAGVVPAFVGLLSQPKVLTRFHAMVGGDPAFGAGPEPQAGSGGGEGLPAILARYLRAEQELGRVGAAADIDAATKLVVGAMHGEVLPGALFSPQGRPAAPPPGLPARLAAAALAGLAPSSR
ncbi:MAG TPA: TetR/AcrR family transcriptional regulator [Streptosporangiaceae bacterium]